jgi:hypothetical protein
MLRWLDGFDFTSTAGNLQSGTIAYQYAYNNSFLQGNSLAGRYGGRCLNVFNTAFDEFILSKTFESRSTWTVGFDLTWTTTCIPNVSFLVFYDSTVSKANAQIGLRFTTSGCLELVRGPLTAPTIIATGSTIFLGGSNWKYVELQITFANSGGVYELRIDDQLELSGTADTQNTSNASANIIALRWESFGTSGVSWDNYYIADTTGVINNSFLGPLRVDTYWPAANDAVDFTPYSGSNYQMVDDKNHGDFGTLDTDYNSTNTTGDIDTFTVDSIGNNGPILGVAETVWCNRQAGQSVGIQPLMKVGGVEYTGSTYYPVPKTSTGLGEITTEVQATQMIKETNPNTGGSWTPSDANSVKYGYKAI